MLSNPIVILVVIAVAVLMALALMYAFVLPVRKARRRGVPLTLAQVLAMRYYRLPVDQIVEDYSRALDAGVEVSLVDLETHHLAGGRVPRVVTAVIEARRSGIELPYIAACALDLTGWDPVDVVEQARVPHTVHCPGPESEKGAIRAYCQDRVGVDARAEVTVRLDPMRVVGGAGQETVVGRLSEAIISAISSYASHDDVLSDTGGLEQAVLAQRLDAGTAYRIESLSITLQRSDDQPLLRSQPDA